MTPARHQRQHRTSASDGIAGFAVMVALFAVMIAVLIVLAVFLLKLGV